MATLILIAVFFLLIAFIDGVGKLIEVFMEEDDQ